MDSGAKSSASPRPRKTTSRKAKTAAEQSAYEDESAADASALQSAPNSEQSEPAAETAVSFQQEDHSSMSQTQTEQSWQNEVQGGGEQYGGGFEAASTDAAGYYEEEGYYSEDGTQATSEYAGQNQNQIMLTLSYSLMNQVRQVARLEGVFPEDILIELIAEGVTRRAFEDAQRPAPSHLMTRTGYVAPDANGNVQQPQLSHHGMQQGNQRGNHQGHNNRRFHQNNNRGNHFQNRNRQNNFKNKQRNGNGNGNGK
jgi:hypothetical protein